MLSIQLYTRQHAKASGEGFRCTSFALVFMGGGQRPSMEPLIHRPLGNAISTPMEFHNKTGLMPIAFEDMEGKCMQRQLQIALVKRERHFYQRNASGSRELSSDEWVHAFSISDLTKYGGIIDQAFLCLPGVKGSVHDHSKDTDDAVKHAKVLSHQVEKKGKGHLAEILRRELDGFKDRIRHLEA